MSVIDTHAGRITFFDSAILYKSTIPQISTAVLRRVARDSPQKGGLPAFERLLDSLGFFCPVFDTLDSATVTVEPGPRSDIVSLTIESPVPLSADSIGLPRFPRPYDAGEIGKWARAILSFLGNQGYPFARISTVIDTGSGDSLAPGSCWRAYALVFVVDPDRQFYFSEPFFTGTFSTRPRQIQKDLLFKEGMLFNLRSLESTARRLESRPYIESVDIRPPAIISGDTAGTISGDSLEKVAVPIGIVDKSGLALDGVLGLESGQDNTWRVNGILDFSLLNIIGVGDEASIRYRGETDIHELKISVAKWHFSNLPLYASVGFGLEVRRQTYGYMSADLRLLMEIKPLWRAGIALKWHENTIGDSIMSTWQVYGANMIIERVREPYRRGEISRQARLGTGAGIADRASISYNRWNVDFSAGTHIPFLRRHAVAGTMVGLNLFTEEDTLSPAELYRIGGYRSVRGYGDNQFAFRNVVYGQLEYLLYFSAAGSIYVFMDGGLGFSEKIDLGDSDYTRMIGYGLGIRIPVKIGSAAIEWARNIDETRGFGRIHVRIRNALSAGAP